MTFEERYETIVSEIERRRYKWKFTRLDFDDVSQKILLRVFNKYHLYNELKGEFTHWLNTLISSELKNILRDNLTKFSRPCILKCHFNTGGDTCSYTKSGKQCDECPIFKSWRKRKESHFNIAQSLPLENHIQEVHNISSDFIDIESSKIIIDQDMKIKLKPSDYRVYKMLYIENLEPEEVGRILNYKKGKNSDIPGYQRINALKKLFIETTKKIIQERELA
jgi:hypothetical protein